MKFRHCLGSVVFLLLGAVACGDDAPPVGMSDAPATEACTARAMAGATLTPSSDAAGAADVVVVANTPVTLTGPGFFTLRVPHPHHDHAIFVERGATLATTDLGLPSAFQAGPCPGDLSDYRVHVHAEGDYLFELTGGGTWLYVVDSPTEHFHPDGGTHDHDGGTHDHDAGEHHDHDAGEHHDHDAGEHHDHDAGEHDHDAGEHAHDHDAG